MTIEHRDRPKVCFSNFLKPFPTRKAILFVNCLLTNCQFCRFYNNRRLYSSGTWMGQSYPIYTLVEVTFYSFLEKVTTRRRFERTRWHDETKATFTRQTKLATPVGKLKVGACERHQLADMLANCWQEETGVVHVDKQFANYRYIVFIVHTLFDTHRFQFANFLAAGPLESSSDDILSTNWRHNFIQEPMTWAPALF